MPGRSEPPLLAIVVGLLALALGGVLGTFLSRTPAAPESKAKPSSTRFPISVFSLIGEEIA